ncbi:DUF3667 domain-containing protein [Flavobacterium sp.]|uniref:DUF3667 domain-containing protein n=1 Tax=Flavobacterium sp. TaxID=239 RepID=UPI003D0CE903
MENCQNCNDAIAVNFCASCGQKKIKRIDKKYIWDELQYTFIHTNKGFLYSIKNILRNPGKTAREFIDGNRVNHYKPINLLFLLVAFGTFISTKLIGFDKIMKKNYTEMGINTKVQEGIMTYIMSYPQIMMVLMIPFCALLTRIVFRKWGNNFYEHVVINTFMLNFYSLINLILLYPILYLLRNDAPSTVFGIMNLTYLFLPFMFYFFFKEFYPNETRKRIIIKVSQLILLSIVSFFLLIILLVFLGLFIAMLWKPEVIQAIKK